MFNVRQQDCPCEVSFCQIRQDSRLIPYWSWIPANTVFRSIVLRDVHARISVAQIQRRLLILPLQQRQQLQRRLQQPFRQQLLRQQRLFLLAQFWFWAIGVLQINQWSSVSPVSLGWILLTLNAMIKCEYHDIFRNCQRWSWFHQSTIKQGCGVTLRGQFWYFGKQSDKRQVTLKIMISKINYR